MRRFSIYFESLFVEKQDINGLTWADVLKMKWDEYLEKISAGTQFGSKIELEAAATLLQTNIWHFRDGKWWCTPPAFDHNESVDDSSANAEHGMPICFLFVTLWTTVF